MNLDLPENRGALIDRVGVDEYNKRMEEHLQNNVVGLVNGYKIATVASQFGELFEVRGTGSAFFTIGEALSFAKNKEAA